MKAAILAVSALFCVVACNKQAAAEKKARDAAEDARAEHKEAAQADEKAAKAYRDAAQDAREEHKEAAVADRKAAEAARDARAANGETLDPALDRNGDGVVDKGITRNSEGKYVDENGRVIDGATPPMKKISGEVRQTARDIGQSLDGDKTEVDRSLSGRVRAALNADPAVAGEAKSVAVRSDDGKVYLRGTVATSDISDRINKIAKQAAGDHKVDNEIEVADRTALFSGDRGKTEADKQVSKRVREALKADRNVSDDIGDMNISTINGQVKLTGSVATPELSKQIARIAGQVKGAKRVDNDLKVHDRVGSRDNN